jgi:hypothetical protein
MRFERFQYMKNRAIPGTLPISIKYYKYYMQIRIKS